MSYKVCKFFLLKQKVYKFTTPSPSDIRVPAPMLIAHDDELSTLKWLRVCFFKHVCGTAAHSYLSAFRHCQRGESLMMCNFLLCKKLVVWGQNQKLVMCVLFSPHKKWLVHVEYCHGNRELKNKIEMFELAYLESWQLEYEIISACKCTHFQRDFSV